MPSQAPLDPRSSGVHFKDAPRVLLVRVGDERALGLDALGAQVLRTAHPMQACERARVVEPLVIVAGETVRPADTALLWAAAEAIGAVVVELAAPMPRDRVAGVLRQSMWMAAQTRAARSGAMG